MFCKAPFTSLMGGLKYRFQVQLYYICTIKALQKYVKTLK